MSETFNLGTDNFVSLAENKLEFARRICSDRELAQCLLSQDRSFKDYEVVLPDRASLPAGVELIDR